MKKFLASLVLVFGFCSLASAHGHGSAVTIVHGHGHYGGYHRPVTVGIVYPRPIASFYSSYCPTVTFNAVSTYPAATSYSCPTTTTVEREVVVEKPVTTTVIQREVVQQPVTTTVQREVVSQPVVTTVQAEPVCSYSTFSAIAPTYGAGCGTTGFVGSGYGGGYATTLPSYNTGFVGVGGGYNRGFVGVGGGYGGGFVGVGGGYGNRPTVNPLIRTGGFLGRFFGGGSVRSTQKIVNRQVIRGH